VWNAWKGKLLEDLFNATRRYLRGGKVADQAGEARQAAQQTLALYAIAPDNFQLLWAQLDNDYFLQHEPHEIAWHTRQLAHRVNVAQPLVKARLSRIGEGIQIMVYSPDQPHLFVRICSFFESLNYNIVEAKIHTTQHGYALDSFLVMDASGNKTPYRDVMSYIEHELATQLGRNDALPAARGGRINRQLKHFPIAPEVLIERDDKGRHLLSLIAGDRPGLLARVAHVFASHGIAVRSAKINTLGSRAEDIFWVTGAALESPQQSRELRDALLLKLQ
jgi:[protein-PII] uridylyltransferase